MDRPDPSQNEPPPEPGDGEGETPPALEVDSRELFRGRREIRISHGGEVYRLRVTRNGRLILNK